ncbi:fimbrial biogenesis chaperone [Sphingopyxis chilensis]
MPPAAHGRPFLLSILLVAFAIALPIGPAQRAAAQATAGSILIWPVNPVINADKSAAALWLENPGKVPVTLQVRIYAWAQAEGKNVYAEQDRIFGTPPIVTIAPGGKQLVRLTRATPTAAASEAAYRVVVDEIPAARPAGEAGAAVSFRMRYSLPLFAYGAGLRPPGPATGKNNPDGIARQSGMAERGGLSDRLQAPRPTLDWRIVALGDGRHLEIRNRGVVHARLTGLAFTEAKPTIADDGQTQSFPAGLFGYVLPGSVMRWPLPAGTRESATLVAAVNGDAAAPLERRID